MNTRAGQFANVSSATGFDFPSDTRGLAAVDWDHDGDLDVWLSHRTSPRLRFLRNQYFEPTTSDLQQDGHWIAIRLRGVSCNRDAIGARVTVRAAAPHAATLTRTLRAGEGYLSQTSKWLHFGLGSDTSIDQVEVVWPGGATERVTGASVDQHFEIVQGSGKAVVWNRPGAKVSIARGTRDNLSEPVVRPVRVVAHRRLPIPDLEFINEDSQPTTIASDGQSPTLVVVWATWCAPCLNELSTLVSHRQPIKDSGLTIVTLCIDDHPDKTDTGSEFDSMRNSFTVLRQLGGSWQGGSATDATKTKLDMLRHIMVSRERPFAIPMSMLLDGHGRLAVVYEGAVPVSTLTRDAGFFSQAENDTRDSAVPFSGSWYVNPVPPDLMSMVEKLVTAELPDDALSYLDRNLLPTVNAGRPTSIWSSAQIADAYFRVGLKLARRATRDGAEHAFATAIDLSPDLLAARAAMASLLSVEGRVGEALQQYEELHRRQPDNPLVLNNIAWILASSDNPNIRNPSRAIALAQQACELTNYQLAPALDTLAASLASDGRYDEAVRTVEKAIELARASGRDQTVAKLRDKLNQYQSQRQPE